MKRMSDSFSKYTTERQTRRPVLPGAVSVVFRQTRRDLKQSLGNAWRQERVRVRRSQAAGSEETRHLLLGRQADQYGLRTRECPRAARNADEQRQESVRVLRQGQAVRQRDIVAGFPSRRVVGSLDQPRGGHV